MTTLTKRAPVTPAMAAQIVKAAGGSPAAQQKAAVGSALVSTGVAPAKATAQQLAQAEQAFRTNETTTAHMQPAASAPTQNSAPTTQTAAATSQGPSVAFVRAGGEYGNWNQLPASTHTIVFAGDDPTLAQDLKSAKDAGFQVGIFPAVQPGETGEQYGARLAQLANSLHPDIMVPDVEGSAGKDANFNTAAAHTYAAAAPNQQTALTVEPNQDMNYAAWTNGATASTQAQVWPQTYGTNPDGSLQPRDPAAVVAQVVANGVPANRVMPLLAEGQTYAGASAVYAPTPNTGGIAGGGGATALPSNPPAPPVGEVPASAPPAAAPPAAAPPAAPPAAATPPATAPGAAPAAAGDPYGLDYTTDPILMQIHALANKNVADAQAASLAARKQELEQFGYDQAMQPLYPDEATAAAAKANPFSTLANLGFQHEQNSRAIDENLNNRNLFYSGERARELGLEDRGYLSSQASASSALQARLQQIAASLLGAQQNAQGQEIAGEQSAYERALAWALRNNIGPSQISVNGLPPGTQGLPPGATPFNPVPGGAVGGTAGTTPPAPTPAPTPSPSPTPQTATALPRSAGAPRVSEVPTGSVQSLLAPTRSTQSTASVPNLFAPQPPAPATPAQTQPLAQPTYGVPQPLSPFPAKRPVAKMAF